MKTAIFILCVTRSHAAFVFIVVVPINLLDTAGQIIADNIAKTSLDVLATCLRGAHDT